MTRRTHNPATRAAGWTRVDFPAPEQMSSVARRIYDSSVAHFGGPYGPRLPLLLTPRLHEPWAALGQRLTDGSLPPRLRELAILVTARFWGADFAWLAHEQAALDAGLARRTVTQIMRGARPDAAAQDELAVRDFCVRLLEDHEVSDEEFARVRAVVGTEGQVELTVLVGHYSGVALMLAAYAAPLPAGAQARLSQPRSDRKAVMRELFVEVADARLRVWIDGPVDAPPLLLSNSLGTDVSMWQPQLAAFTERFQVIRYDMRGHGASQASPGPYDLDRLGQDAIAVLDVLGLERADFCGLSLGGMVGQWLAIHHPDRLDRLVIANAGLYIPAAAIEPRLAAVRASGLSGLVEAIVPRWFTAEFVASRPEVVEHLKKVFLANSEAGYLGCCAALGTLDHRASIDLVKAPTLVIGGAHDPATLPEHSREVAARVHGAELVMLEAAHLSNIEQPEVFTDAVLGFLDQDR